MKVGLCTPLNTVMDTLKLLVFEIDGTRSMTVQEKFYLHLYKNGSYLY